MARCVFSGPTFLLRLGVMKKKTRLHQKYLNSNKDLGDGQLAIP